ncbi:hypothetical protein CWO02_04610 [Vibrio splendidus]|nr:hypothetical protein CWO02_04610 [Vibrio splendidus]
MQELCQLNNYYISVTYNEWFEGGFRFSKWESKQDTSEWLFESWRFGKSKVGLIIGALYKQNANRVLAFSTWKLKS